MTDQQTNDGETLALGALGWVLADAARAERLLALTGLTPEGLRARVQDRAFLAAHIPDLMKFGYEDSPFERDARAHEKR